MSNVQVDNYVTTGSSSYELGPYMDVPISKATNRRKKDVDPNSSASSGKKRGKPDVSFSQEEEDRMAAEVLTFMCGGNAAGAGDNTTNSSILPSLAPSTMNDQFLVPGLLKEEMIAANKRMRVTPASSTGIPLPPAMALPLNFSFPPSLASFYGISPSSIMSPVMQQQMADVVKNNIMSTAPPAKRPKSASTDIYVPLCRAFSRPQVSATQLYQLSQVLDPETQTIQTVSHCPPVPDPLTVEFILEAAGKYEHLSQLTIDSWRSTLQQHMARTTDATGFVDSLMSSKDTAVKVIYSLIHCALYLLTEEGQLAWQNNYAKYRQWFKDTLLQVVEMDNVKDEAKNQSLIATLPLAFFCVQKLMPKLGLRDNLCLFLALISCLEGRGKYHGRAGDNLPFAHKCYRYLVEILGGKVFRDIPESEQSKADKELSKLFESHTSLKSPSATNSAAANHHLNHLSLSGYSSVTFSTNNNNNNNHNNNINNYSDVPKSTTATAVVSDISAEKRPAAEDSLQTLAKFTSFSEEHAVDKNCADTEGFVKENSKGAVERATSLVQDLPSC